ncbi:hypothetical protein GCM10020000_15430 [Streptomyces olivoverticillatus]
MRPDACVTRHRTPRATPRGSITRRTDGTASAPPPDVPSEPFRNALRRRQSVNQILDAILASDSAAEDFAALPLPESYRAVTVHKDEAEMFAGLTTREKDPPQIPPRRGGAGARTGAR